MLNVWPTPEAEEHIAEIGAWWHEHRTAASHLFRDELAHALATIAETPLIGAPYKRRGLRIPGLRSLRLHTTPYRLYYVPLLDRGEVVVLAVWGSMRGHGPPLRMP